MWVTESCPGQLPHSILTFTYALEKKGNHYFYFYCWKLNRKGIWQVSNSNIYIFKNSKQNLQNAFCVLVILKSRHGEHEDESYIVLDLENLQSLTGYSYTWERSLTLKTETITTNKTMQLMGERKADYTEETIINVLRKRKKMPQPRNKKRMLF